MLALLLTIVTAVGLGLALAACLGMGRREAFGDEKAYLGTVAGVDPHARGYFLRVPLLTWLLGRRPTKSRQARIRLAMALLSVLTVALTTLAGWYLGGLWVAALSALLLLLQPERIVLSCHVWPDGPLAFLATAVTLLLLLPAVPKSFTFAALGVACALGCLARIDFLVVVPTIWLSCVATGRAVGAAELLLLAGPCAVGILAWSAHNARRYGLFMPDNTWTFNLLTAEEQLKRRGSVGSDPEDFLQDVVQRWQEIPPAQRPRRALRSLAVLLGRPGRFLRDVVRRTLVFCGPDTFVRGVLFLHAYPDLGETARRRLEWPLRLAFPLLAALAVLGVASSRWPFATAYAWPALALAVPAVLFVCRTRFRFAVLPALSLLAAQGLTAVSGLSGGPP